MEDISMDVPRFTISTGHSHNTKENAQYGGCIN